MSGLCGGVVLSFVLEGGASGGGGRVGGEEASVGWGWGWGWERAGREGEWKWKRLID